MVDVSPALPKATHEGVVSISDARIRCYVLEDGTRVLSQRGINEAFGVTHGGKGDGQNSSKMPRFLATNKIKPFLFNDLAMGRFEPLAFARPKGGKPATAGDHGTRSPSRRAVNEALEADYAAATASLAEAIVQAFTRVGAMLFVGEATNA